MREIRCHCSRLMSPLIHQNHRVLTTITAASLCLRGCDTLFLNTFVSPGATNGPYRSHINQILVIYGSDLKQRICLGFPSGGATEHRAQVFHTGYQSNYTLIPYSHSGIL